MSSNFIMFNSFDIDGVISVGIFPGPRDIIVTGRSFEESSETLEYLRARNIKNTVYFNSLPFDEKTRESSGYHKARILANFEGQVQIHFEDDPVQWGIIEKECPWLKVVHVVHDLTEKENVRGVVWK